jgi:ATP-dependent RNA helicase SUPV3L1/SUV3
MVNAEVTSSGELSFEGQIAGRIQGFRYTPDAAVSPELAMIDNADTASAITQEFALRANRLSEAVDSALVLASDGAIRWLGEPIAKIAAGEGLLAPRALILADETLTGEAQQKAQTRVDLWLAAYVKRLLGPLFELEAGVGLEGAARNVAARLVENLGVLERGRVAQDVKSLDQNARGMLRKLGVRFGAYYIYIPALVKPAIRVLATQLWALRQGGAADGANLHEIPQLAASGRTSFVADNTIPKETYRVAGFRLCGERAVRVDIVERLADLIRPAVAYRPGVSAGAPPTGSADGDAFVVTGAMTSLTGCSGEQFASVLRSLGFVSHLVKGPALTPVEKAPEPAEAGASAPSQAEAPAAEDAVAADDAAPQSANEAGDDAARDESVTASDPQTARASDLSYEFVGCEPAEAETPPDRTQEAAPDEASEPAADALVGAPAEPEPAAAEQAQAPVEVEEALVEVWRPRPPVRQRSPRGARGRPSAQDGQADPQAAHSAGAPDEAARRRRRPPPRPQPSSVEADSSAKAEPQRFRGRRPDRRNSENANNAQGPRARGGQNSERPKDERGRRERRPEEAAPPVPRREAPINLDSPFAKLLALKAQLETKGKGE